MACCNNETIIKSCCGELNFKDASKIENPENPIDIISMDLLDELMEKYPNLDFGFTDNIDDLFLHDYNFDFSSAIVISCEMYQEILDVGSGVRAQELNDHLYEEFGNISYEISDFLRKNGFETLVAHPREEKINFSLLAQRANMAMIGKSGLAISPRFGPKHKISAILLNIKNLPIERENPHLWIREYCENCNSCVKKCPEKALNLVENKTILNDSICLGCDEGCTECIKACPFYKRGYEKIYSIYKKIKEKSN